MKKKKNRRTIKILLCYLTKYHQIRFVQFYFYYSEEEQNKTGFDVTATAVFFHSSIIFASICDDGRQKEWNQQLFSYFIIPIVHFIVIVDSFYFAFGWFQCV